MKPKCVVRAGSLNLRRDKAVDNGELRYDRGAAVLATLLAGDRSR